MQIQIGTNKHSSTSSEAAHFEYIRRGRPLRKPWWNIKFVSSFMAVHMENKTEGEDLGAWGSWFSRGYEDKPAPMPAFILQKAKSMNMTMAETEDEITIVKEEARIAFQKKSNTCLLFILFRTVLFLYMRANPWTLKRSRTQTHGL